ncbi:hypothetical protein Taro_009878 [Colocasia esculenta]|uniref:Uncharacterized protein n=1 Tax=Colocasia esculenta TaxID=4460 RepID=A0A843U6W3_COLES|nr:hypothetical protein [Colocasia esculenta]
MSAPKQRRFSVKMLCPNPCFHRPPLRPLPCSLSLSPSQPRWKRAVTSWQIVQVCFSSSTPERLKASTAPAPTPATGRPGP